MPKNWAQSLKSAEQRQRIAANQMAHSCKGTKNGVSFKEKKYLKTARAITMKFGFILKNRMLNPSTMSKKKKNVQS